MTSKRTAKLLNMAQNINIKDSLTVPMRRNLIHEFNATSQKYVKNQENVSQYNKNCYEIDTSKRNYVQEWVNQCDYNPDNSQNNEDNNILVLNGENYEIVIQEQNYRGDTSVILGTPEHVQSVTVMDVDNTGNYINSNNDFNNVLIQQDNHDDISVILGTPEHVQSDVVNVDKKKRISIKGITRQFRQNIKEKRNSGKEYITQQGKLVPARMSRPLTNCRSKCKQKVDQNLQQTLFDAYWSLKSYDRRVSYIASLIVSTKKVANRKRTDTPEKQKNRQITFKYFIPKNNELIVVCKLCFLNIFGEKPKFIQKICTQKVQSPIQKQTPDKRGKSSPINKKSKNTINLVLNHIKMLPSYESHYCRKETTKKYLPAHFTLKLVYDDYVKSVNNPVSITVYRKYFKQAGLKIKNPKKDTCALCDSFKIQISNNISSSEEKAALLLKKNKHHDEAEETYEAKRKDSKTNDVNKCVIAFDLQQCLPTPSLESSVAFYKRQLWTFNLTVHNIITSNASCYIWNETIAKRGANDIGSCIFHYLANLPSNITHVVMYSDNCAGQNKNSIFMAMCLAFLEQQDTIKIIDHKFMISGHTRMECDSDHGRIEKAKKRYATQINHPYDWSQLIRFAGKEKFNVIETEQSHFQDFHSLLKTKYQLKKKNEAGQTFLFRNVQWLRYNKCDKNNVFYKLTLKDDEVFHKMDLTRRNALCNTPIPKAYSDVLPITEEKKKDLISLLQFIPEIYHPFYQNLKTANYLRDPLVSDEEGE